MYKKVNMKKVLVIVCLVLAAGAWYQFWYKPHSVERSMSNGETTSPDGSAPSSSSFLSGFEGTIPTPPDPSKPQQAQVPANSSPSAAATPTTPPPTAHVIPATDTISPNPPNGMVFAGTGRFQVYRQGNLTWRVNTDSGQACILFATDSEWRKPRVYEHGCSS